MAHSQKFTTPFDMTEQTRPLPDDGAISPIGEISPRNSTSSIQEDVKPAVIETEAEIVEDECPEHHGIYWTVPFTMLAALGFGIATSGAHSGWYQHLNFSIVGTPSQQENNIRFVVVVTRLGIYCTKCVHRVGNFLAFLTQISLGYSCWIAYRQWVWRALKFDRFEGIILDALDAAFALPSSLLSLSNLEIARKLPIAYVIAVIAW
jgi:hypothetical protein